MHYIGIDIGGTNIKAGRIDDSGQVSALEKAPTPTNDLNALVATIERIVVTLQSNATVSGIGIGVPGLRNARTGIMASSHGKATAVPNPLRNVRRSIGH